MYFFTHEARFKIHVFVSAELLYTEKGIVGNYGLQKRCGKQFQRLNKLILLSRESGILLDPTCLCSSLFKSSSFQAFCYSFHFDFPSPTILKNT